MTISILLLLFALQCIVVVSSLGSSHQWSFYVDRGANVTLDCFDPNIFPFNEIWADPAMLATSIVYWLVPDATSRPPFRQLAPNSEEENFLVDSSGRHLLVGNIQPDREGFYYCVVHLPRTPLEGVAHNSGASSQPPCLPATCETHSSYQPFAANISLVNAEHYLQRAVNRARPWSLSGSREVLYVNFACALVAGCITLLLASTLCWFMERNEATQRIRVADHIRSRCLVPSAGHTGALQVARLPQHSNDTSHL